MAPATPSSINCVTRYNQRSATSAKKLLKQAIATVSTATITPIPKLPPIVPCVMGGEPITGHGSIIECEEADVNLAAEETDVNLAAAAVKFEGPALRDVVCPDSMFNKEEFIDDPHYVCAAKCLC
jgi:hypothetical protein